MLLTSGSFLCCVATLSRPHSLVIRRPDCSNKASRLPAERMQLPSRALARRSSIHLEGNNALCFLHHRRSRSPPSRWRCGSMWRTCVLGGGGTCTTRSSTRSQARRPTTRSRTCCGTTTGCLLAPRRTAACEGAGWVLWLHFREGSMTAASGAQLDGYGTNI